MCEFIDVWFVCFPGCVFCLCCVFVGLFVGLGLLGWGLFVGLVLFVRLYTSLCVCLFVIVLFINMWFVCLFVCFCVCVFINKWCVWFGFVGLGFVCWFGLVCLYTDLLVCFCVCVFINMWFVRVFGLFVYVRLYMR